MKQELIVAQEKIRTSSLTQKKKEPLKEEDPSVVHVEENEENGIILDLEKKGVESKLTLEVMLPIISQSHF